MNNRPISAPRKLNREEYSLLSKKITAHLPDPREISAEQKMFAAVIQVSIQDLGSRSEVERRKAWRFLTGETGDIDFIGGLADIAPDYIKRILNTFFESPFLLERAAA